MLNPTEITTKKKFNWIRLETFCVTKDGKLLTIFSKANKSIYVWKPHLAYLESQIKDFLWLLLSYNFELKIYKGK